MLPEIKEYERTSTTVINAYVMPVVRRYLATLQAGLGEIDVRAPLMIMQSNGGLMTAAAAAAVPMHIIESGPAAGVVGAQVLARRMALPRVITFDMGGTTAKASIVEDGEINQAGEYQVGGGIMLGSRLLTGAGYLLRVPSIDLAEVGAGGGSLVWVDAGGALQVGPRSAGAFPGPLCYDLGGAEPTITDANVILGYLNPTALAGGAVKLNAARAREGFEEKVARRLGLPLERAAHGAHLIAASNMMRAIRAVSSERGRDPREYALFAFGGNGPLFAAGMAAALEMRRIVVPPAPGLFSSFGLLYSDVEHHYVRSHRRLLRGVAAGELEALWARMEEEARAQLGREGFAPSAMRLKRSADLRYQGQSFELTVPVPARLAGSPPATTPSPASRRPSGASTSAPTGIAPGPRNPSRSSASVWSPRGSPIARACPSASRSIAGRGGEARTRRVYFGPEHGFIETAVVGRGDLAGGRGGPLIVEEYDATCVVTPGAQATLDPWGNIVIDIGPEAREGSR